MNVHEVVIKLVGEIRPVGDSRIDRDRFEHLRAMTGLIEKLLIDIDDVAHNNKNSYEGSRKSAGEYAFNFLDHIRNLG